MKISVLNANQLIWVNSEHFCRIKTKITFNQDYNDFQHMLYERKDITYFIHQGGEIVKCMKTQLV